MTDTTPKILAAGKYAEADIAEMRQSAPVVQVTTAAEVPALDETTRAGIRAVAAKAFGGFGGEAIAALPNLGLIANFGVGYDNIDVAAARARGVRVTNTPDVLTDDTADLAVGMLLALSRQIARGDGYVRSGRWAREGAMALNRTLNGRRVGILGLGRIGRAIADRLAPFGVELHYFARNPRDTPGWTHHANPVALAHAVDDLIVTVPGGPETAGIVSGEVLAALGADGQLVNIARGSCVDEAALLDALEAGAIRGAALDVFENEPDIDPRFLALDNALLQPHQGSATVETRSAMGRLQRDNIAAFFRGAALLTPVA